MKGKISTSANNIQPIIQIQFASKSHIYMVTILANSNAGSDDSGSDEPLILKEAKPFFDWKKIEKAMYVEFQSFIEKEYKKASIVRIILTSH